jgi:CDP-diglyceride synthetase
MKGLLRFAACFNIGAGLHMLILYHETYKVIGMPKPEVQFPIQLVGLLVALFGVGYYLVARHPVRNRQMLVLGWWSKFLGSCLGLGYIVLGKLPAQFFLVFFFADIIYLWPFYLIMRRLNQVATTRPDPDR